MDLFLLGVVLYLVIGIFMLGIFNGYSYEKLEGLSVVFILFYPIIIIVLLVMSFVYVLYKLGEKIGRKVEKFANKIDW